MTYKTWVVVETMIKSSEGLRLKVYPDVKGIPTIGYGRNLRDVGIGEAIAETLLNQDMWTAYSALRAYAWFEQLSETRQAALFDMMFTLGATRFAGFARLIKALEAGNYSAAAGEMESSEWNAEAPERVARDARMMREG